MSTLYKLVDGVRVPMPAGEAAATRAEWAATAAKQAAEDAAPKEPSLAERVAALETLAEIEAVAQAPK